MLIYAMIFFAKIIEVALATFRLVMITRGERLIGAIIGFVEVIIWILVVSQVIKDITSDPLKIVVYALGFSIGNYLGSYLEERVGIGTVRVEAIVTDFGNNIITDTIRKKGFAVTEIAAKGLNLDRKMLIINVSRKEAKLVVEKIKSLDEGAVITLNNIKPMYGGYRLLRK